jgi:pimeloyl-ACP methyl ester carboxylesterase
MSSRLVSVNGTRLFVDDRGPQHGPTLLYLHGGPGLGCHDFMAAQGDRLARSMRVVSRLTVTRKRIAHGRWRAHLPCLTS